jgi:hypothetical protein
MKRRAFLAGVGLAGLTASPALAADPVTDIVAQLKRQGFERISTARTLLGRVRIVAERSDGQREIIVNPNTGEILRDLWTASSGRKSASEIVKGGKASDDDDDDGGGHDGGHGGDGDDDDDDDDDDDSEGG